jgi:hypothetical protein
MWAVYRQQDGERRHHFAPLLPTKRAAYVALYWFLVFKQGVVPDDYGLEWVGH